MKTHIRSIELLEARIAPATFTVTTNANGGAGSLGEAIVNAANSMGTDTILFNLPAGQLTMTLPGFTIDHPVIFDGRSQPGYVDSPLVVLQGAEFAQRGFRFVNGSGGSQVLGMKITDFDESGILIDASDITVAGCDIVGNAYGISVNGARAVVGGSGETGKNVISGNTIYGITGAFTGELIVQNSHIGVSRSGTTAMGNGGGGIFFDSSSDITIGGVGRNVISANGGVGGIWMINCFGNYRIQSSSVGLSATGAADIAFSNSSSGVYLSGGAVFNIGSDGLAGSSANVITNNNGTELAVNTNATSEFALPGSASIKGNYIGTTTSGMTVVPATAATLGIRAQGPNIVIGGAGPDANTIFSQADGIAADPSVRIFGNEFFPVNGLLIDVEPDGATPNDVGELDAVQNKPEIAGVAIVTVGNQYAVTGTLDSKPDTDYLINIYGFDGQRFSNVSTSSVRTDANGHYDISLLGISFAGFTQVAATVTDELTGNTSEMSAIANVAPGIAFVGNTTVTQIEGNTAFQILTFNVIATAPLTGGVSVDLSAAGSNTATSGVDYSFSPTNLSFGPAVTSQIVNVIINGDTNVEPEEVAKLVLGNLSGNAVLLVPSLSITIGNDDTSLKISPDSKSATWLDADGDIVTLKTTKPVLNSGMFTMNATGPFGGEILQSIDFNFANGNPKGTNLAFTAKFDKARNRGDAAVDVGTIFAGGTDLGIVTIPGDLGAILVGDATVNDGAVKTLTVGSIGVLGAPQPSVFRGKVGALTVRGDVVNTSIINDTTMEGAGSAGSFGSITIGGSFEASVSPASRITTSGDIGSFKLGGSLIVTSPNNSGIFAGGKVGSMTIGGSLIGADGQAVVFATTTLGKVTVGGNLDNAYIGAAGNAVPVNAGAALAIASVSVKGRVQDSIIESGVSQLGQFNPDTQIGTVSIGGDWIRSSVAASVSRGADGKFGTADDSLLATSGPFTNNTAIVSKIAAVFVKGQIFGTSGGTDNYGFVAQTIGKLGRGAAAYSLKANPIPNGGPLDVVSLGISGDVFLREVL